MSKEMIKSLIDLVGHDLTVPSSMNEMLHLFA